jgi:hypothetical protein
MMDMFEVPWSRGGRLRVVAFLLFVAAVSALVVACGGGGDSDEGAISQTDADTAVSAAENLETVEIPARWATANADSVSALVTSSQEVFTARVARLSGEREQVLNPARGSSVPISIYELEITESFVGGRAAGSVATFEQAGGAVEQGGEDVWMMLEGDPPVEVGKEYLFFASLKENGTLSAPPYGRLEVTAGGDLVPLAAWESLGALQRLQEVPADQVSSEIDAASE